MPSREDRVELSTEEARLVRRRSLNLLAEILKPVRGHLLLTLMLVVVAMGLNTVMPWLISQAINTSIEPLLGGGR